MRAVFTFQFQESGNDDLDFGKYRLPCCFPCGALRSPQAQLNFFQFHCDQAVQFERPFLLPFFPPNLQTRRKLHEQ